MSTKQIAVIEFTTKQVRSALTRPANTTAYTAGDVLSGSDDGHLSFARMVQSPQLSGSISTARVHSSANQATKADLELWLFSADIADRADNATFIPTDTEMLTLLGIIPFPTGDWTIGLATAGAGGNAVCEVRNLGLAFKAAGSTIYGQLVVRNAYTPISGEVFTVDLVVTQD